VVQKLLRKARKGARLIYVPGNHDEFLRDYFGTHFGGIEVVDSTIHAAPDGVRYLVIYGDHFDLVVTQARWLALLGDKAYEFAIVVNRIFTPCAADWASATGRCRNGRSSRSRTR
jgi:UDP-2,3-diacylglucosamine pyrophosphatase LpxH